MKKTLALVALLLVAALAQAGSYTVTTTSPQDNRLEKQRVRLNKATCAGVGLPGTCTQAQARAKNPGVDVYSDVADMLNRKVIKDYTDALKQADTSDDEQQFCAWFKAATVAQQNSACALASLPNGCEICP